MTGIKISNGFISLNKMPAVRRGPRGKPRDKTGVGFVMIENQTNSLECVTNQVDSEDFASGQDHSRRVSIILGLCIW